MSKQYILLTGILWISSGAVGMDVVSVDKRASEKPPLTVARLIEACRSFPTIPPEEALEKVVYPETLEMKPTQKKYVGRYIVSLLAKEQLNAADEEFLSEVTSENVTSAKLIKVLEQLPAYTVEGLMQDKPLFKCHLSLGSGDPVVIGAMQNLLGSMNEDILDFVVSIGEERADGMPEEIKATLDLLKQFMKTGLNGEVGTELTAFNFMVQAIKLFPEKKEEHYLYTPQDLMQVTTRFALNDLQKNFFAAACTGRHAEVAELLDKLQDESPTTFDVGLLIATVAGHQDIVRLLLEKALIYSGEQGVDIQRAMILTWVLNASIKFTELPLSMKILSYLVQLHGEVNTYTPHVVYGLFTSVETPEELELFLKLVNNTDHVLSLEESEENFFRICFAGDSSQVHLAIDGIKDSMLKNILIVYGIKRAVLGGHKTLIKAFKEHPEGLRVAKELLAQMELTAQNTGQLINKRFTDMLQ